MRADYKQFSYLHPKLILLIAYIEERYGFEFTNTSPYRIGDDGVHGTLPCRGHDLRCRDKQVGYLMETQINAAWQYDPTRTRKKVCVFHDTGSGLHLHLQVNDNTIKA